MGTVFGLLFTGAGLLMLILGFVQFRTSRASRDWPSVEGQVTEATVETKIDRDEDGASTRYSPRIIYTYSVSGQQYTSDRVVIGARQWHTSQTRAEAKLVYRPGQQVTVYYNPGKPSQAVLEAGATRGAWGTLAIGIIFTILGAVVLVINVTNTLGQ
jgi:uncharacterized integral membrane protein